MTPIDTHPFANARRAWPAAPALLVAAMSLALTTPAPARADAPYKLLSFRSDSSNGGSRHPIPGPEGPWVDLTGNGHDAALTNFYGNRMSGWAGDGTTASPYRLECAGFEQYASVAAGSVPELQTVGPVTAEVWFKTGFDAPLAGEYQYLLEWLQTGDKGMSIAISDQQALEVYLNGWVTVGTMAPDTWHHVAVAKDSAEVRIYVDGVRRYTGTETWNGIQQTPISIGASIFRVIDGTGTFGDYLHGSIAQVDVWRGALGDSAVAADFDADSALYPTAPLPAPVRIVSFLADQADGADPYPSPGISSSWVDLEPQANAELTNFDGTLTSGWLGDGSAVSPHRLVFDGQNDVAVVPAMTNTVLEDAHALSAELWFLAPSNVGDPTMQYLLDWYGGLPAPQDMSVAVANGQLLVDVGTAPTGFQNIAPIGPSTWHHVIVAKQPGEVRIYLDGQRVYTGNQVLFAPPFSNIAIGASTYGGDGVFADWFNGSIAQVHLWLGAVDDSLAHAAYVSSAAAYTPPAGVDAMETGLALAGMRPNPATGPLNVSFSLPSSKPARLDLVDVTGRRVKSMDVGALGAGRHLVQLGHGRDLAAGVYWLRLTQGSRTLTTKATVVH